eukprot:SAG22_NODE_111_length_19607_cov_12.696637_5_plen_526_part_00
MAHLSDTGAVCRVPRSDTRDEWITMAEAAGFPTILSNSPTRGSRGPPHSPYSPGRNPAGGPSKNHRRNQNGNGQQHQRSSSSSSSSSGRPGRSSHGPAGRQKHGGSGGGSGWDSRQPVARSRLYSSVDSSGESNPLAGVRSMVPGRTQQHVGGQAPPRLPPQNHHAGPFLLNGGGGQRAPNSAGGRHGGGGRQVHDHQFGGGGQEGALKPIRPSSQPVRPGTSPAASARSQALESQVATALDEMGCIYSSFQTGSLGSPGKGGGRDGGGGGGGSGEEANILRLSSEEPSDAVVQRLREQLRTTDEVVEELHTRNRQLEQQAGYLAEQLAAVGAADASASRSGEELEAQVERQAKEIAALKREMEEQRGAGGGGERGADGGGAAAGMRVGPGGGGGGAAEAGYRELAARCDALLKKAQNAEGRGGGGGGAPPSAAAVLEERLGLAEAEILLESERVNARLGEAEMEVCQLAVKARRAEVALGGVRAELAQRKGLDGQIKQMVEQLTGRVKSLETQNSTLRQSLQQR